MWTNRVDTFYQQESQFFVVAVIVISNSFTIDSWQTWIAPIPVD